MKGNLSKIVRRNSTMEPLSAFADERQDITTSISTPTKKSRLLATASMIFEELHSPRQIKHKERMSLSVKRSSPSLHAQPKNDGIMNDIQSDQICDGIKGFKALTISIARQPSPSGSMGIGLLLCTHHHGFQIIGIQGESASKNLVVSCPHTVNRACRPYPRQTDRQTALLKTQ